LELSDINGIAVSSVVPALGASLNSMAKRYFNRAPLFVDSTTDTGLRIRIENPSEVGADRIVNSVAAYRIYGGPCVAVDFGTAINFDVISDKGEYIGGLLCPGINVASEALARRTARLPQIDLTEPAALIGTGTVSALQAGLFYGTIGLLDGISERLREQLGEHTKFVGAGGQAHIICPRSKLVTTVHDYLTLEGLRLIWERNQR
jgi:type III pantothenate kinase